MSSLSRRNRSARPDAGEFMPPNLISFDATPFGDSQRVRLHAWLREAAWPRDHMGFAELEGYLVALVAWPVGIASGAWMPPIWGERGWKVPTKIATRLQYEEFVGLIAGFLQHLDRELSRQPTRFESSVLRAEPERRQTDALRGWGRGFMTALTLGSQGLKWRSGSVRAAVQTIANRTASPAHSHPNAVEEVVDAVLSLLEQRASRGPLGPLDAAMANLRVRAADA